MPTLQVVPHLVGNLQQQDVRILTPALRAVGNIVTGSGKDTNTSSQF